MNQKNTTFKKDGNEGYDVFSNGVKVGNVRQCWDGWHATRADGFHITEVGNKTRNNAAQELTD